MTCTLNTAAVHGYGSRSVEHSGNSQHVGNSVN